MINLAIFFSETPLTVYKPFVTILSIIFMEV